ncbi:MAG: hypothetical protein FWD71_20145 [Oscillospiraceae bacterium]|nr:hypothetical protein [Oscillospiraceae bacterium]
MARKYDETDIYYIPSNFIESGTLFGGMLKLRNVIEAVVILIVFGLPILRLNISVTAKVITSCFTALPLCLLALIGVSGESLSSFIIGFIKFLKNRRVVGSETTKNKFMAQMMENIYAFYRATKKFMHRLIRKPLRKRDICDFGYKKITETLENTEAVKNTAECLPILKIENGVIYTKDRRYIKVIEIEPINFLLRSEREQKNIIYSFISYLKISPIKLQFKVISKRADINRHLEHIKTDIARETDEKCIALLRDYENLIR